MPLPPIWLLGSSGFSAQLAAQIGTGFAFAHHINEDSAVPAMTIYRERFTPSVEFPKPHAILAASVICADTDEEAEALALSVTFSFFSLFAGLKHGPLRNPSDVRAYPFTTEQRAMFNSIREKHIVGSPDTVRALLDPLLDRSQADELMVLTMVYDHQARLHSYKLLSDVYSLVSPTGSRALHHNP